MEREMPITTAVPAEQTTEQIVREVQTENQSDKLSNKDALRKAITESRADTAAPAEAKTESAESSVPTQKEVRTAVAADIEPPAEFSAAGKDAWRNKDISGIQKEFRRIHDGRTQEISRAQTEARRAAEESRTYKEMARKIAPYIEARGGEGVTPEQAIMEAVALIEEIKKNPKDARAQLEALGLDFSGDGQGNSTNAQITGLQKTVDTLLNVQRAREFESLTQTFDSSFRKLGAEKTRTGEPVFPDLFDSSDAGKQLSQEIGSLVGDARFRAGVTRRIPDADHAIFCREAYKYLGGRVVDDAARVSKDNPKHIEKSRRAAASTPGAVVARDGAESLKGKLGNRAALSRAMQDRRQEH